MARGQAKTNQNQVNVCEVQMEWLQGVQLGIIGDPFGRRDQCEALILCSASSQQEGKGKFHLEIELR